MKPRGKKYKQIINRSLCYNETMKNSENTRKKLHIGWIFSGVFLLLAILLNLLAWNSRAFCDAYVTFVFPIWVNTYARLSGIFPFSVGEYLLYGAVILTADFVIFLICHGVYLIIRLVKKDKCKKTYPAFMAIYEKTFLIAASFVFLLMTLNCYILYHVTPFSTRYELTGSGREYTTQDLAILRDYVVEQANALAEEMERDEKGELTWDEETLRKQAVLDMQKFGETYPMFAGYYPKPKGLSLSWFYSQQYIMGYYFPFSMEANYNRDMYVSNMPATMCHELSHLKGNIYEDEANFIGYLACEGSEDAFSRYSAYLSVLPYVNRDFKNAVGADSEEYLSHPAISEKVQTDRVFLTEEAWEKVEEVSLLDTQKVKEMTDAFLNTNLTVNGVSEGIVSYSQVVKRLLAYYDGILY